MTPMLLDINGPEFVLLLVLAIILFGPERLPELARKAARVLRYVRTMAGTAQEQLSKELGPGFEDLDLRDLNPRTFVQKHLMDDVDPIIADVKKEIAGVSSVVAGSSGDVAAAINGSQESQASHDVMSKATPSRAPFDAEAT